MATALLSFESIPSQSLFARSFWYMGGIITIHADSQDTHGRFAFIEANAVPGSEPPLHIHAYEDELIYVLEGSLKIYRDGEELMLQPGESVFLPRHVPHTFKVMSPHARLLVSITPGGFEGFFRELGEPMAEAVFSKTKALPTPEEIVRVAGRYGITFSL